MLLCSQMGRQRDEMTLQRDETLFEQIGYRCKVCNQKVFEISTLLACINHLLSKGIKQSLNKSQVFSNDLASTLHL